MPNDDTRIVGSILVLLIHTATCLHRLWRACCIYIDESLREVVNLQRSIIPRCPKRVTFHMPAFLFSSEGDDESEILLPNDAPKILIVSSGFNVQKTRLDKRTYIESVRHWGLSCYIFLIAIFSFYVICIHIIAAANWFVL